MSIQTFLEKEQERFDETFPKCTLEVKNQDGTTSLIYGGKLIKDFLRASHMRLLEEVGKILESTEEYIAVQDNDTHRYQIPLSKKEEWEKFCAIPEEDESSWDVPEWAERIDGMPVESYKERIILAILSTKEK